MRPLFNHSRSAGWSGPIDHDGRKRARNEDEYDDADARHRSCDHSRAMRGGPGEDRARDRESKDPRRVECDRSRRRARAATNSRNGTANWIAARSVAEIMIVESRAAASYWRTFRDAGLRERKNGNLPRSWLRFAQRNKGAAFLGNQHASHPINAMLNYCYIVEAGRLAKALAVQGLCLSIGFLHSDKKGRNSLVWDAIEPLRPAIDAKVFAFIEAHEFARRDFPQSGYNVHRLSRDVTQLLLHKCSLPAREIEGAAEWMMGLMSGSVGAVRSEHARAIGKTKREPQSVDL